MPDSNFDKTQITIYKTAIAELATIVNPPSAQNYYPILHTPLANHTSIEVSGRFETNDSTSHGVMSYVTVLHDSNSLDPSNGLGFAWRKGDGNTFNVYLVDNNSLTDELFVNPSFITQDEGENSFLAAGKKLIAAKVNDGDATPYYKFKLRVSDEYAMDLWIWSNSDSEPDFNNPATRTIYKGPFIPASDGTHFSIGVLGTENSQWWYDDILITTTVGIHTAALLKMKADPTLFLNNSPATLSVYGYGLDGSTAGLTAYVRTKSGGDWIWTTAGTHTYSGITPRSLTSIKHPFIMSTDYRDTDNFVYMLLTTPTATSDVTDVTLYYASLENIIASGVHTGGKSDIYIHDSARLLAAVRTINNTTNQISLTTGNGFYTPLQDVVTVTLSATGEELVRNQDWSIVSAGLGNIYSTRENPYLAIDPAYQFTNLSITYRYYADGDAIQTSLSSDEYRYSGTDNLAKIMPLAIVKVYNLTYTGAASLNTVKNTIKNYVNSQTVDITLHNLLSELRLLDITDIDESELDIRIVQYNYLRQYEEISLTDTYTLPARTAFFTDIYELTGVIQN